jgi:hypothetical protein
MTFLLFFTSCGRKEEGRKSDKKESVGLFPVNMGGKTGFINREGKLIINPQYDNASNFYDGLALVTTGGKSGYIDKEGKTVINPQFDIGGDFSEGLAAVSTGGKWGYIDKDGKYVWNLSN